MTNIVGKTTEERVALDIAAETAKQNWLSACTDYNRAVEETVKKGTK